MKKTRILSLLMVLLLVASALGACNGDDKKEEAKKRDPGEILNAASHKNLEIKSVHSYGDMSFEVSVPESLSSDAKTAMLISTLNGTKLKFDSIVDQNTKKGHAIFNVDSESLGADLELSAYILSDKQLAVKVPGFPQTVTLGLDDLSKLYKESSGIDFPLTGFFDQSQVEKANKFVEPMLKLYGDSFKDEKPQVSDKKTKFSTGEESVQTFTYSYKGEETIKMIDRVVINTLKSENIIPFMEQVKGEIESNGGDTAAFDIEQMKAQLAEALKQYEEKKDEALKTISDMAKFNELTVEIGVDSKDNIRNLKLVMDIEVKDPSNASSDEPIKVKTEINIYYDMIDAVKEADIKTIDLEKEPTISFMELNETLMKGN